MSLQLHEDNTHMASGGRASEYGKGDNGLLFLRSLYAPVYTCGEAHDYIYIYTQSYPSFRTEYFKMDQKHILADFDKNYTFYSLKSQEPTFMKYIISLTLL